MSIHQPFYQNNAEIDWGVVLPHPGPLALGEGESFTALRNYHRLGLLNTSRLEPLNYQELSNSVTRRALLPLRVGGVFGADGERAGVRWATDHLGIQRKQPTNVPVKI